MLHRRNFLKLTTIGSLGTLARMQPTYAQSPARPRTRVVFLGTKGGPRVETGRSNPANLIEINGTRIVLDCGMGVSHQLAEAKVPLPSVKYILISHHHSDHNLEYGNLVYNAWASGLSTPIQSFGPKGLQEMTKTYWELNKFDVETRIAGRGTSRSSQASGRQRHRRRRRYPEDRGFHHHRLPHTPPADIG